MRGSGSRHRARKGHQLAPEPERLAFEAELETARLEHGDLVGAVRFDVAVVHPCHALDIAAEGGRVLAPHTNIPSPDDRHVGR